VKIQRQNTPKHTPPSWAYYTLTPKKRKKGGEGGGGGGEGSLCRGSKGKDHYNFCGGFQTKKPSTIKFRSYMLVALESISYMLVALESTIYVLVALESIIYMLLALESISYMRRNLADFMSFKLTSMKQALCVRCDDDDDDLLANTHHNVLNFNTA